MIQSLNFNIFTPLLKKTDFKHCKIHEIQNNSTEQGSEIYSTSLFIYRTSGIDSGQSVYLGKNCLPDLSDIAFFDAYGNYCDYWIEHDSCYSDGRFVVWIRFPHLSPQSFNYLFIFYGGMSRQSFRINNGGWVFNNFSDWELRPNWPEWIQNRSNGKAGYYSILNTTGGTTTYGTTTVTRTAGTTTGTDYSMSSTYRLTYVGKSIATRFRGYGSYLGQDTYQRCGLGMGSSQFNLGTTQCATFNLKDVDSVTYPRCLTRPSGGGLVLNQTVSGYGVAANTFSIFEIRAYATGGASGNIFYINDSQVASDSSPYVAGSLVAGLCLYRSGSSGGSATLDWIHTRQIVYPEPIHTFTWILW